MPAPSYDDRQRRLAELAGQWGVVFPSNPGPMTRPARPASYRTSDDDFHAEELVKRKQLSHGRTESTGNLRKAFSSSKKKAYEPSVVFAALGSHVANCGSPGVAESLISLLTASGGDVNLSQKPKTGLLSRRRSLENFGERSKVLQNAVQNGQVEMVQVLLPHADTLALDSSLPIALRKQNLPITELLLRYGAGVASTADGQEAFRQACAVGSEADLVALVLRSEGRPSMSWISQCMVDAAHSGCLETVMHLSRSISDGGFNKAEALKTAISQSRRDVALAIVMGSRPPHGQGLDEAFTLLMDHPSMNPNEKVAVAELLLCAGADGDAPAWALLNAADSEFLDIIQVLVGYGVSIEYKDAFAVRRAIKHGRVDVAHILLNGNSSLSSVQASECVEMIPKSLAAEHRRLLLETLLRKGAGGDPLNETLIEAAEAGDTQSVHLLLTPQFPGGRQVQSLPGVMRRSSKSMVFERHEVASVDYKEGVALQIAVRRGDVPIVKMMLASKPSNEILASVFPQTKALTSHDRYGIVECFLSQGLPPNLVQDGLQEAIDEKPPRRDESLIALLLKHTTDINSHDGALASAVAQKDVKLLAAFLKKKVNPQVAGNVLSRVMMTPEPRLRLEMTSLILGSVSGIDPAKVSSALLQALNAQPSDLRLLQILLQQGRADINIQDGAALAIAIRDHDPPVLDMLLKHGTAVPATMNHGFKELAQLPSSERKAAKLQIMLSKTNEKAFLNDILVREVRSLLTVPPDDRTLSIAKVLLSSGADVNANNAAALCHAIAASDRQLTDMLFKPELSPTSLASALPHALSIPNSADRLSFAKRLLDAGAPGAEANRALGFAIGTYADDMPLLRTLSVKANTSDGEALVAAVKRERPDIVELLVSQRKHPQDVLDNAFTTATKSCEDKEKRARICELLLGDEHRPSGPIVSDSLQAAAADGDLVLGSLLVEHGVGVNDEAIVQACRSGSVDVLNMLLGGRDTPDRKTLEKGFQSATEVGDLKRRAAVLEPLLERGVGGDAVNSQLVSAVRYGGDGEDLVKILLCAGADPNYYNGEAVWAATRSAYLGSLTMMLGVSIVPGSKQPKPSEATLKRALVAAWKLSGSCLAVLDVLFKAGLPACEELHMLLNKAVNEEVPDEQAIEVLVRHGASPAIKNCKTLVEATQRGMPSVVQHLLDADISNKDLDLVIRQSFHKENADSWFSDQGFSMLQSYLDKRAQGQGPSSVLVAVLDMSYQKPQLADRFIELLFSHDVNVDYEDGRLLESATSAYNLVLIKRLLEKQPSSASLSRAFHHVFDRQLSETEALDLISLFTDYADGESRLDVMHTIPDSPPVLFLALSRYPRSVKILKALLNAGFYHDQITPCRVVPELDEDEAVTLLTWALLQPQKKVSSNVILSLIESGAKVNYETKISRVTPLMLAVHAHRQDIVKALLLEGAEVDVADAKGNTPLSMATDIGTGGGGGGDLAITIMSNLLAAGASKNDGSLHNAARELNLAAVQVLVEYGHDPDFPSPLHDGRSALGEVCLRAAENGDSNGDYADGGGSSDAGGGGSDISPAKEKQMEKVINYLIDGAGSDLTLKTGGKSVLHLALESRIPTTTTRLLLKVGMWKHINKRFNLYSDGTCTYSPTMYVKKVLPSASSRHPTSLETPSDGDCDQLLALLRANRCEDVYYANAASTEQPDDAVGLPDDLAQAERERRARLARLQTEAEDHRASLARTRELASLQAQIFSDRADLEDARRRRAQAEEEETGRRKVRADEEAFAMAMRRRGEERNAEMMHEKRMTEAARARGAQDLDLEAQKRTKAIEWDRRAATERVDHAKAMSALRIAERQDEEKMDRARDERVGKRLAEQRRLVESQSGLAGQIAGAGVNGRKQIGYVAGELN